MALKPTFYAELDGNRKPWYVVAIESGISTGKPVRDFRIVDSEESQTAAVAVFREKYGLNDCRVYIAEGYFNILG